MISRHGMVKVQTLFKLKCVDSQRDTETRVKKADYLFTFQEPHRTVHLAEFPGGKQQILDGNSRTHIWKHKLSDVVPEIVRTIVYQCKTQDQANELYRSFDSQRAVKKATDDLASGERLAGLTGSFSSKFMARRNYAQALKMASGMKDRMAAVGVWAKELRLLDNLDPNPRLFITPVTAAFLMTVARHGEPMLAFWQAYQERAGTRTAEGSCPILALDSYVMELKARGYGNYDTVNRACQVALALAETWLENSGCRIKKAPKFKNAPQFDLVRYREFTKK